MISRILSLLMIIYTAFLSFFNTTVTVEYTPKYCNIPNIELHIVTRELPTDYDLICSVVMNEAGAEPYDGMCAVAQCIYNACEREEKSFSQIRNKYGYYYTKSPNDTVKKAVKDVFCNGYKVTKEKIICYYNPSICRSSWHESQKYVMTIAHHRFFAYWE